MAWWKWRAAVATLGRHVGARIVNVSARGCLIESATRLPEGTVGILEVDVDGNSHLEAVLVRHSIERRGHGTPFLAGVQFLGLSAPRAHSPGVEPARVPSHAAVDEPRPAQRADRN